MKKYAVDRMSQVGEHEAMSERRGATYEDLERVPANRVGEIVAGELHMSPRPSFVQGRAAFRLAGALTPFDGPPGDKAPGGWVLLFAPELHLGGDVLVPDLAGWRRERLPQLPDTSLTLAPDWVCEVLSPATEALDRAHKMDSYAREGVSSLWLVNPRPQLLEVYRLAGGRWSWVGAHLANETVQAEPFESLSLKLGSLWER